MYAIEVGKLYNPNRKVWPETTQYNFRDGGHELVLFYRRPTASEIQAVRTGKAEFALAVYESVLFFLSNFGGADHWDDAPFSIHLVPEAQRTIPPPPATPETRALLSVILVDAASGLVRAMRQLTLSPDFTAKLVGLIHAQAALPFPGQTRYDQQVAAYYRRYNSNQMATLAAVARCVGGE